MDANNRLKQSLAGIGLIAATSPSSALDGPPAASEGWAAVLAEALSATASELTAVFNLESGPITRSLSMVLIGFAFMALVVKRRG